MEFATSVEYCACLSLSDWPGISRGPVTTARSTGRPIPGRVSGNYG